MLLIYLAIMVVYVMPGMLLARGMYSSQIREIRNRPEPVNKVPERPVRPRIEVRELLHYEKCKSVTTSTYICTCESRSEWEQLRYDWKDYNSWVSKYGHLSEETIRFRNTSRGKVNTLPIYVAVPFWPLVGAGMYIKGGAKNIPDYREIERLENDMKEIN